MQEYTTPVLTTEEQMLARWDRQITAALALAEQRKQAARDAATTARLEAQFQTAWHQTVKAVARLLTIGEQLGGEFQDSALAMLSRMADPLAE